MKSFLRSFGFVVAMIAAIFLFVGKEDMGYAFSEPVDINGEEYVEDYSKVKAVKTDIYMVLDVFAELETTTTNNGAVTDRDYTYYYIMPVFTEDDTYYVGVEVDEDDDKKYDKLADLTWEWLNGEENDLGSTTIPFEGGFVKMEDECYKYYLEWFEEAEWFESKEEMEKYALPMVLKPAKLERLQKMIIGSAIALAVGIIMIIIGFLPSKKKELPAPTKTTVEINGINYPISNFENVNKNVVAGKKVQAVKELGEITGLDLEASKAVIDSWEQYWY